MTETTTEIGNALAHIAAPVETVTVTVTHADAEPETYEVALPHGDTLADKRLLVSLVGVNHSGVGNPENIVVDVPAAGVAGVSFAAVANYEGARYA